MNGRRLVHGNDAEGLQSLGTLQHLTQNPSTLIGGLVAVAAQTSHVQKYVRHPVVRDDESEALGDIEPLNDTAQFNEIGRRFIDELSDRSLAEIGPSHFDSTPSDAMTPNAATLLAPLDGRLNESCRIEDNTGLRAAKGQNRLAHSSIHSVARGESVRDEGS